VASERLGRSQQNPPLLVSDIRVTVGRPGSGRESAAVRKRKLNPRKNNP
jgi:hypothetical protein